MAEYSKILSTEQKVQILQNKISQLIIEGYQNNIALRAAEKSGDQEYVDKIKELILVIDLSFEEFKKELDSLSAT